jgi:formylglycine-generating enzyme required for sulfatase activity
MTVNEKTKIFVSYSRHDAEFVANLVRSLASQTGFEVFQDTADILPSEEWRQRLASLIGAADTIIFCLSPNSAKSEVCFWEVALAEKLNKRIIPVVIQDVDGPVPGGLAKLNYIFFKDPSAFESSVALLLNALQTDIAWIREHSRIGEQSRRWESTGKRRDLLVRGAELQDIDRWVRLRPADAPSLTGGTLAFLDASQDADRASRRTVRRVQTTIIVLLLAVVGGLVAYINQDYLREQYVWWIVMRPSVLTPAQEKAKAANPSPETAFAECARGCPTLVVVPSGVFMMGSPESLGDRTQRPQHLVTIAEPFAVARTEITFAEWDTCVAAGGCPELPDNTWGRDNRPAIFMTWDEAKRYTTWLSKLTGKNYRLLSEAEWEYAAGAGSYARWSFGNDEARLGEYAWFYKNSGDMSQPVAMKKPNAFGLHDLHGNVSEWLEDCWHDSYTTAPADGSAWTTDCTNTYRANRGGTWVGAPSALTSVSRNSSAAGTRHDTRGFRVARDLTP